MGDESRHEGQGYFTKGMIGRTNMNVSALSIRNQHFGDATQASMSMSEAFSFLGAMVLVTLQSPPHV